jgi:hypothetical protein
MKKLIFSLLVVIITGITTISCTEEDVKPRTETNNNGGSPIKE